MTLKNKVVLLSHFCGGGRKQGHGDAMTVSCSSQANLMDTASRFNVIPVSHASATDGQATGPVCAKGARPCQGCYGSNPVSGCLLKKVSHGRS